MSEAKRLLEPCIGCGRPQFEHCASCGTCRPVPGLQAAVDALERLVTFIEADGRYNLIVPQTLVDAREALRRLRGTE